MRTKIKNVVKACDAGNKDAAVAAYKDAVPLIDSMINKGKLKKINIHNAPGLIKPSNCRLSLRLKNFIMRFTSIP